MCARPSESAAVRAAARHRRRRRRRPSLRKPGKTERRVKSERKRSARASGERTEVLRQRIGFPIRRGIGSVGGRRRAVARRDVARTAHDCAGGRQNTAVRVHKAVARGALEIGRQRRERVDTVLARQTEHWRGLRVFGVVIAVVLRMRRRRRRCARVRRRHGRRDRR